MTDAVISQPVAADEATLSSQPAQQPKPWLRLAPTVLAGVVFVAALLDPEVRKVRSDSVWSTAHLQHRFGRAGSRRSVILTWRNLGLAAAMVAAFAWIWLWHGDLPEVDAHGDRRCADRPPPGASRSRAGHAARHQHDRVAKRGLILALCGLVTFAYVYLDRGVSFFGLAGGLGASCLWHWRCRGAGAPAAGADRVRLLRHPLRREVRPHLLQCLDVWLCCGLLGGVLSAGGAHYARIGFSLNAAQFDAVIAVFTAGLVLLAALAVVPRRRVYVATNVAVASCPVGLPRFPTGPDSALRTDAVVLDSPPLTGESFVQNGGRSILLNGRYSEREQRRRLPADGRRRANARGRPPAPRWPTTPASVASAGARSTADRRGDRRLPPTIRPVADSGPAPTIWWWTSVAAATW